jgi:UDP:flavonoid glycosyltransferase YjiC (YdhE family)
LPPAQGEVVVVGRIFAQLNVAAMLPTIEAAIEDWQPDLVAREPNEYASAIAAERRGVPQIRIAIGLALAEQGALMFAAPALEAAAPGIVERIAASRYVTCFPESIDEAPFSVERYRDPAVDVPSHALPDWWPDNRPPLVYLSFGSVAAAFASAGDLYTSAVEQVASLPVRVLLTLGRDLEIGPVPSNVRVEQWVPQADILDHADAVVCHGGSGTTLGALAYGVPLVVVPLFADQPYNAARVAAAGAGVVAPLDGIAASLEGVLGDRRFRAGAQRVAAEMRGLPPVADLLRGAI